MDSVCLCIRRERNDPAGFREALGFDGAAEIFIGVFVEDIYDVLGASTVYETAGEAIGSEKGWGDSI